MTTVTAHNTNVYVGLAGESALIIGAEGTPLGEGGMYRLTEGQSDWACIENGLPENPQVRALLGHPDNPATIFAGTQDGVYRSDDRGENWRRTDTLSGGRVVAGGPPQRFVNHVRRLRRGPRLPVQRRRRHLAADEHRGDGASAHHHEPA